MVRKNDELNNKKNSRNRSAQEDESGEYGVEQILASNEEDLQNVHKNSSYHYSGDELKHRRDEVKAQKKE